MSINDEFVLISCKSNKFTDLALLVKDIINKCQIQLFVKWVFHLVMTNSAIWKSFHELHFIKQNFNLRLSINQGYTGMWTILGPILDRNAIFFSIKPNTRTWHRSPFLNWNVAATAWSFCCCSTLQIRLLVKYVLDCKKHSRTTTADLRIVSTFTVYITELQKELQNEAEVQVYLNNTIKFDISSKAQAEISPPLIHPQHNVFFQCSNWNLK
jgi:hypothetical protein